MEILVKMQIPAKPFVDRGVSDAPPRELICPCCGGKFARFLAYGRRPYAQCPDCGALERHRLAALYFKYRTNLFHDRVWLLDIAPKAGLQRMLFKLPKLKYVSADIKSPLAIIRTDIRNMAFPSDHFDVVICMHVLEHVSEDRQAIAEIFRVMKPGGWGILDVPVDYTLAETIESSSVPLRHGHVRTYGLDYKDRLAAAGFTVELVPYPAELGENLEDLYGLKRNTDRYNWICTKPKA